VKESSERCLEFVKKAAPRGCEGKGAAEPGLILDLIRRNWLPRLKHGLRETQQANHNLAENLNVTFEFLFSLSCPGKTLFELGPVSTCFAPALLREKWAGKARSAA
jgi:hypothetical protein